MLLLLLLFTPAFQIYVITGQTSPGGPRSQEPPGVEVLGYDVGPGWQVPLDPQSGSRGEWDPDSRSHSGDWDRNTTRYTATGDTRGLSMEASVGADPYYNNSSGSKPLSNRLETAVFATVIVRNNGPKAIKVIEWDFPHPHIANRQPVLRSVIRSHTNIKPGEIKTIRAAMQSSDGEFNISRGNGPERSVTFMSSQHGISFTVPMDCLREGARILRIKYNDGSSWQRP